MRAYSGVSFFSTPPGDGDGSTGAVAVAVSCHNPRPRSRRPGSPAPGSRPACPADPRPNRFSFDFLSFSFPTSFHCFTLEMVAQSIHSSQSSQFPYYRTTLQLIRNAVWILHTIRITPCTLIFILNGLPQPRTETCFQSSANSFGVVQLASNSVTLDKCHHPALPIGSLTSPM